MNAILGIFTALFSVVNPLGAVPLFLSLTADNTNVLKKQKPPQLRKSLLGVDLLKSREAPFARKALRAVHQGFQAEKTFLTLN